MRRESTDIWLPDLPLLSIMNLVIRVMMLAASDMSYLLQGPATLRTAPTETTAFNIQRHPRSATDASCILYSRNMLEFCATCTVEGLLYPSQASFGPFGSTNLCAYTKVQSILPAGSLSQSSLI